MIRFAILFAFLAILLIGGFKALAGELPVATYSVLVFITQRLLWPLTAIGRTLDEYQRSMASTQRVLDLIDTPVLIQGGTVPVDPQRLRGEIRFEAVDFAYAGRSTLLQGFRSHRASGIDPRHRRGDGVWQEHRGEAAAAAV